MENQKDESTDHLEQPDRSHLADLYPTAKTMEQRVADKQAKADQRASRLPKHVNQSTMLRLYSVLVGLFAAIHGSIFSLDNFGVIAAVSFSFLLGLMWLGYTYWMYSRIAEDFARLTYTATPLLALYTAVYPLMIVLANQFISPTEDRLGFVLVATLIHFVFVYVLMKLVGARS